MNLTSHWDFFSERWSELIKQKKVPHLLLLNGSSSAIKSWLIEKIFPHYFSTAGEREQDLLWLSPSGNEYKLEDLATSSWNSFFSHRPVHSPYRVIVFEQSEALSDRVANRLLKDLEDTPSWISIVMLYSGERKVLPTIKSRAISWRLPKTSLENLEIDPEWLLRLGDAAIQKRYGELPELLKEEGFSETDLMELLHQSFLKSESILTYEHCEKWLAHLKWWKDSTVFHQSKWERLLPFCVFSAGNLTKRP